MTRPQLRDLAAKSLVLALGQRHQAQQRVRHAAAGGQHDAGPGRRQRFDDGRHSTEAVGVGNARPPELVHDPGIGLGHRVGILTRNGSPRVRDAAVDAHKAGITVPPRTASARPETGPVHCALKV